MKQLLSLSALLLVVTVLTSTIPVFAQDNEATPPAADKTEAANTEESRPSSSQEVEINEDTYRQFMELKDANRPGDIIPETAFKPGSGLQKLDKLPEESQKHLRNELREIIVQGDPWQPGDENADYPYTPSAAASKNPALQKQEQEAWGELVDSYNQREAQIYAERAGNRATMNPQDGQGGQPGGGAGKEGKEGEDKEGLAGQATEQESSPDRDDTAGAFSPDAVNDPNAQNTSGVSQNALEFLQGLGGTGENAGAPQGGGQQGSPGSQGQGSSSQQNAARQAGNAASASSSAAVSADTSTAGTSQNAMDFLNQATAQAGNTDGSQDGSSADGSQGESAQSNSATAQADGQQSGQDSVQATAQNSGQDSGQATAQNSGQETAEGEESAEGTENGEQGDGQAGSQTDGKSMAGEQSETAEKTVSITIPDQIIDFSASEAEEESTAGSTQSALEFLQGESGQTGVVTGGAPDTNPPSAGTLSIQDLLNAQGVGGATGTVPEIPASGEGKPADETNVDKDGGGR